MNAHQHEHAEFRELVSRIQYHEDEDLGSVAFIDHRETIRSELAEPRDIELIEPNPFWSEEDKLTLREEIAVEIRRHQGHPEYGIRKNLKWET